MNIVLNNRQEEIEHNSVTITELLKIKNFTFKMLVVKKNGNLIKKSEYDKTIVENNDNISILHLISGG